MVRRFPTIHGVRNGVGGSRDVRGYEYLERIPFSKVQFHPDRLDKPFHWRKPRRVGVNFLGDMFDDQVPFAWVKRVLDKASFPEVEHHQFFFLTKQVKRMRELVCLWAKEEAMGEADWKQFIISNWFFGVSITSQPDLDRMGSELLRIPGKLWISYEPAMEAVSFRRLMHPEIEETVGFTTAGDISWLIIGSHNNPRLHPCKLEWVESAVEQAKAAGIPVYVKQIHIGGKLVRDIERFPKSVQVREYPE